MLELYYFYLHGCPYCQEADRFLENAFINNPSYRKLNIRKIEEQEEKALADSYDYYFVPCFFLGTEKLHEGAVTQAQIQDILARTSVAQQQ